MLENAHNTMQSTHTITTVIVPDTIDRNQNDDNHLEPGTLNDR